MVSKQKTKNTFKCGVVSTLKDGIAQVLNLNGSFLGEAVWVRGKGRDFRGLVMGMKDGVSEVVLLDGINRVREGDSVIRSGNTIGMVVSKAFLGRVVSALGRPLDGRPLFDRKEKAENLRFQPFFNSAPEILDRDPVNEPLNTGYKCVDSLIPIGLGQRELVIGDRKTGKTSLLVDTIINQKDHNVICVYVMTGQKRAEVARIIKDLQDRGAMDHTIIVCADSAQPAGMQYLSPFAGFSIADYFRKIGSDVLVILDDLSKHADSYRQMSLLLRRPPGREAFPGDVFYLHSRILERAANTKRKSAVTNKQGSITALPVIETQGGDVSAYIPTNVISITDGQIFLDKMLFNKGIRPALNVGLSVSRVGSAAQTKAMKKLAGRLKFTLAEYNELSGFSALGGELDAATQMIIDRGARLTQMLKQKRHVPLPYEEMILIVYAGVRGYLDEISVDEVRAFETFAIQYFKKNHPDILSTIKETKDLSKELDKSIGDSFTSCLESFSLSK